jgi:pimeloyl-ACP methyl ester carboxylesterase
MLVEWVLGIGYWILGIGYWVLDIGDWVLHSDPAAVCVNGIEIVYDSFGDFHAPPLLLVMGLSCQMIHWDEAFCAQLAARGYWVVRFDNRDAGLSTSFDAAGVPNITALTQGQDVQVPYLIRDMADDAVGLLDALGIERVHVVGLSMGGMIVQRMASHYPGRVMSMTCIMSSSGAPGLPPPTPEAWDVVTKPVPTDRQGYIESVVQHGRVLSGSEQFFDEAWLRALAGRLFERGINPRGTARQLAAIIAAGSFQDELKSLAVPTLVIHGDADPLVPVECGLDTANVVPGARLTLIEGLGHAWPPAVWPQFIEAIVGHALLI